jgi:hypothetical protein
VIPEAAVTQRRKLAPSRWTIRLLAEHVVERKIVDAAHFNTVGRALKKTISNRT